MKCYIVANTWFNDVEDQIAEITERYQAIQNNFSETILVVFGLKPEKLVSVFSKAYFFKAEIEDYFSVLEKMYDMIDSDSCVLFGHDLASRQIAARLALRKHGSSIIMADSIIIEETGCVVNKKIYSGNIMSTYKLAEKPYCISVAKQGVTSDIDHITALEEIESTSEGNNGYVRCVEEIEVENKIAIDKAKKVLVLGNGVKKAADVEKFQKIADRIGAVLGGSRPVVMQGLLPKECMVGVSGNILHADVCVVVGASGMAAFYEGIERSKLVISVNRDNEAPIVKESDKVVISKWEAINWNN